MAFQNVTIDRAANSDTGQPLTIKVPDYLDCLPERVRRPRGAFHNHPSYVPTVTDGGVSFKEERTADWNLLEVSATKPTCKVTFHRRQPTFSYLSLKNGHSQTGESAWEKLRGMELEVDPNIVDYQLGAVRMRWNSPAGERTYTADAISLSAEGHITIEEVKASASYFAEPGYSGLMRKVGKDLQRFNVGFSKRHADEMLDKQRRCFNVAAAFDDRFVAVSHRQSDVVLETLSKDSAGVPLGVITAALALPGSSSRKIVNALMCKRYLAYNLDLPITPETQIMMGPKVSRSLPDIRSIRF